MLETTAAKIGFFIYIIITLAISIGLFRTLSDLGKVTCPISLVITIVLLYSQNWAAYFWFVLIVTAIVPFLPITKLKLKITVPLYLFTVGLTYLVDYGAYGILYALNN